MYTTTLPPTTSGLTGLLTAVWIDSQLTRFQLHPGSAEPGGVWSTPSAVTPAERPSLVAAFNSGFKFKDARGGYFADGRWAPEPQAGAATAAIDNDGVLRIGQWGRDFAPGATIVSARQNLVLLIDNGVPSAASQNPKLWGATIRGLSLVWRSALAVTADGAVVYVAGPSQSVSSLVAGLVALGAREAMELDINFSWVTFNLFAHDGPNPAAVSGRKLVESMSKPAERYLTVDTRDFFTVMTRA
jgi:hypothetical protein